MTPEQLGFLIVAMFGAGGVGALTKEALTTWRTKAKDSADARREDRQVEADVEVRLSAEWQQMIGRLEARIIYLEAALANLHSEYLRVVQENATMKAELHASRAELHAAEMRVQQLTNRVAELESQMANRTSATGGAPDA